MLNIIKEIQNATGNDKIKVMKKYPELKEILIATYDPFKKYYITAPEISGTNKGCNLHLATKSLLADLSSRELSGNLAYESVCNHITTLNPDHAEVFKMIINKDLRAGINIKSINKAWPGLIHLTFDGSIKPDIMLLRTFNPKKAKYPLMVAVKKDGVRGLYTTTMLSRPGHKLIGHDHIEEQLEEYSKDFDGELCVPGKIFDVASGLIRNDKSTPESVYWIFDCPSLSGTKRERWNWLSNHFCETFSVKLISHYTVFNEEQLMKFYKWSLFKGEEGIVIYDPDDIYEDKRSYSWMRLVPLKQADCVVIGFYEGKGKHAGSLGGIIIDYKGHEVRVGTGFKEKISDTVRWTRQYIWDNQRIFLGAIVQIEFKEETKAGSMRQPRFKRWRFDK